MKLLLFDIDGTILTTFGQAKNAFEKALNFVFGTAGNINKFSWSGKLDPVIVFELMEEAGFSKEFIFENLEKTLNLYEKFLEENLDPKKVILKEGIVEVLEEASKREDIILGLCTGNTPNGARIKLSSVNLWNYFKVGAFGTDGKKRIELPPIAKKRAEDLIKKEILNENVFVIGDSPLDIESGKANGFKSIAVSSGFHKKEELEILKPDLLIENFKEGKKKFWGFIYDGKP